MPARAMKVGTLAEKTGLTVRTLRYYDEIGLLTPSHRSRAGYRLYEADDISRLQQILSLRQLGFSLATIQECLDQPTFSPSRVVQLHLSRVREQIERQQQLQHRLEMLAAHLNSAEEVPVDAFIQTIEEITMLEKYYTPEQLDTLDARAQELGEEGLRQAEAEWEELFNRLRAEMEKGTDPASAPVQELARRARGLIEAFTGGDPEIAKSLKKMYNQEGPEKASRGMADAEVHAYMGKAMKALEKAE